jgi:phosphatidylserine/phosphatidylglycerophosphate/cardiolipin synthase-like enzyme
VTGLVDVALPDIERLLHAVKLGAVGPVFTEAGLARAQLGHLGAGVAALLGCDVGTVVRVLEAVRDERLRPPATRVSLVWTGPETRASAARDTAIVVRELFAGAQRHVLVAGYSFERGEAILEPLHAAMRDRGVHVELFVHLDAARDVPTDPALFLETRAAAWRAAYWPFGPPVPALYVDPRAAVPGSYASLHAKCVVVDGARALVGSANFTDRGQTRNIEAGVLVEDGRFAEELVRQFHGAVGAGLFVAMTTD